MTDRHAGYIVTLAEDIRDESAEPILNALRMIKGVVSVEPIVADYRLHIAKERVDDEWRERIRDLARHGTVSGR